MNTGENGPTPVPDERAEVLAEVTAEYRIRDREYETETERFLRDHEPIRRRNQRWYRQVLGEADLIPLGPRDVLDVGCGRGEFLAMCRDEWGHSFDARLAGIDLDPSRIAYLEAETDYEVVCGSADELAWPDACFDLVHQSMLQSSVPPGAVRSGIFAEMGRVTRPGGFLLTYDFFFNPINRKAYGIRLKEILDSFPGFSVATKHRITPPPQLTRIIDRRWPHVVDRIEQLGVMNLWHLVLLRKDS